jgi:hypothetical protein
VDAWTAKAQPSLDPGPHHRVHRAPQEAEFLHGLDVQILQVVQTERLVHRIADLNCAEIAETAGTVSVRDSKTPAGPILTVDPAVFTSFVNWTSTSAE